MGGGKHGRGGFVFVVYCPKYFGIITLVSTPAGFCHLYTQKVDGSCNEVVFGLFQSWFQSGAEKPKPTHR